MIKNLVILGGGTSGLVTALLARQYYSKLRITLVKSSSIGIIGVGEGSTEHWSKFAGIVGLSISEILKETGATLKSGIKFENWNGDSEFYMHSITSDMVLKGLNTLSGVYMKIVSEELHHHYLLDRNLIISRHIEPLESSVFQFHFDTFKLNDYLLKKCAERNIDVIDTEIVDVNLSEDGFVTSLVDKDNRIISGDFFIDSSGFKRVISSKLGAKWQSIQKYLPMNSAIAFPTTEHTDFPSHTISKALSAGWLWRIPTQERYGNGYVYCDKFISDDDAVKEAQTQYSEKINVARSFKFDAGYVDKFWIKNCVSLGLSGSFVEPLEATSIGTSIQQAFSFCEKILTWYPNNECVENLYNNEYTDVLSNIVDFIQLHYLTKRNDSEFWKYCKTLPLTPFNEETLEIFKKTFPTRIYFKKPSLLFVEDNWTMIMHGLGMFDSLSVKKLWDQQDDVFQQSSSDQMDWLATAHINTPWVTHREAIETLKAR